ncbi:nucleotide-diphospho-sugar transferase [Phlyctochytrium arcticum]|nr:nucleotide-diphospho-sugar transferase [Phlyctochytrium arcticum]
MVFVRSRNKAKAILVIIAGFALLFTIESVRIRIASKCERKTSFHSPLEDPPIPALFGTFYSDHDESDWLRTRAEYQNAGLKVPNLIHQTAKYKNNTELGKSWREKNPDWIHVVWDDADIMTFFKELHPNLLSVINALKTPVEKTDLWRYLVLFTYGGIYADQDATCEQPISTWPWPESASLLVSVEAQVDENARKKWIMTGYNQFQQWFLASRPGHPLMYHAVEILKENVERDQITPYPHESKKMKVLLRTGPGAWSDAVHDFLRTTGYRDFDVVDGNITLGDVAFFDTKAFREHFVRHHFAHSWH